MAQKTDFPQILKNLRLKKGISQKSAAASLGISQALLSHYEKGIRECGLHFLTECAKFYDVSADYLLGLTKNENAGSSGSGENAEHIKNSETMVETTEGCTVKKKTKKTNPHALMYKNLLKNSLDCIFDNAGAEEEKEYDKEAVKLVGSYFILAIHGLVKKDMSVESHAEMKTLLDEIKKKGLDFSECAEKEDMTTPKMSCLINVVKNAEKIPTINL